MSPNSRRLAEPDRSSTHGSVQRDALTCVGEDEAPALLGARKAANVREVLPHGAVELAVTDSQRGGIMAL